MPCTDKEKPWLRQQSEAAPETKSRLRHGKTGSFPIAMCILWPSVTPWREPSQPAFRESLLVGLQGKAGEGTPSIGSFSTPRSPSHHSRPKQVPSLLWGWPPCPVRQRLSLHKLYISFLNVSIYLFWLLSVLIAACGLLSSRGARASVTVAHRL